VKDQHWLDGVVVLKNESQIAGNCHSPKRNQPLHAECGQDEATGSKSQRVDTGHRRRLQGLLRTVFSGSIDHFISYRAPEGGAGNNVAEVVNPGLNPGLSGFIGERG
jgi:hypothetical protein